MRKALKIAGTGFTVLLLTISILIARSSQWILATWAHLTADELIFHLKSPLTGADAELIGNYIHSCLLPALVIGLIFVFALFALHKRPLLYYVLHGLSLVFSLVITAFSLYHIWSDLKLTEYAQSQSVYSDFIDTNYVNPENVQITFPEKKRNLIHIYLESMETTYANIKNGGGFEENVIPELTELAQTYEDFSGREETLNGAIVLSGSTWTMGGLFAQTSGLPLALPIDGNAMNGQSSFLPELITLGDILEDAGYHQAFLIGSDADFGGRELYFKEHGDYKIWDYNYFTIDGSIPEDYYVFWGFEDLYLLEFAKEKLTQLSQQAEPFNLTMLTVDTHFEDGYVCEDCQTYYEDNQYANVMRCSSSKIAELISWIQEQDFYENTTIVITGDHLTMDSDFCNNIPEDYQRKVYTAYINAPLEAETANRRTYSSFDIFPTTLASLGVKIEGNRLGLGTNLFSDTATLCEQFGTIYVNEEIQKKSELMDELTADITYAAGVISISPYKAIHNSFMVLVNDMDFSVEIKDMRCLVWTKEDQSDAKWYILPYDETDNYTFTIPVSDFPDGADTFYTEVFIYGKNTMMYSLGTANETITR